MIIIAVAIIATVILIKYKPIYKISILGEELGYVKNKQSFEEKVKEDVVKNQDKNVDSIDIKTNPQFELKLVDRTIKTNEEELAKAVEDDIVITYKYYGRSRKISKYSKK